MPYLRPSFRMRLWRPSDDLEVVFVEFLDDFLEPGENANCEIRFLPSQSPNPLEDVG